MQTHSLSQEHGLSSQRLVELAKPFSLAAGLNYSMQGCKWSDYKEGKAELKEPRIALGYINLPIVANVYLFKGFAIKAGV